MIRKLNQSSTSTVTVPSNSLDLSINEAAKIDIKSDDIQIPSKTILNNSDLSRLKGFTAVRKKIKQQAMKDEFVNQVSGVLDLFDKNDNKYESEITQFVCSVAEDYFVSHTKMGTIKEEAVIQCVSLYFNNDILLVKKIIQLVLPNVTKSNIFRRNKNKVFKFFFYLVRRFS